MRNATDRDYLRGDQYGTTANLDARLSIHLRFSTNPEGWHRWLFERMAIDDGARILECGCGPGTLWTKNADRVPRCRLTLTDLSTAMAERATAELAELDIVDVAAVADVQSLPFVDGGFDIVVANHMLYHVPDRDRAIEEIARVLRPGGKLIAATNGERHIEQLHRLAEELGEIQESRSSDAAFSLENGEAQLAPHFDSIDRHDYPDSLRVTDPDAIIDYLVSGLLDRPTSTSAWREILASRIERDGAIEVTKSSGVFVARKE